MPIDSQIGMEEQLLNLPDDQFKHDALATHIMSVATYLPEGSVIAIEGSWGRGKTDLLRRVARKTFESGDHQENKMAAKALWLNPWQYGKPDLLTPLIRTLANRLPLIASNPETSKVTWRAVASLLGAGAGILMKTAPMFITGFEFPDKIADFASKGIQGILEARGEEKEIIQKMLDEARKDANKDPSEVMGKRFQELVAAILKHEGNTGKRLLVCLDDMDRCMPNQQVALLEALHFLTVVNAPVIFLIAIDPTLAEQAVRTYYKVDHFDPRMYLDKIFSIRFGLPSLAETAIVNFVDGWYSKRGTDFTGQMDLFFGKSCNDMKYMVATALSVPALRNPRVVERIMDRLAMLSLLHSLENGDKIKQQISLLVLWIGIGEKWRDIRLVMQTAGNKSERLREILSYYRGSTISDSHAIVRSLPEPKIVPDLVMIMQGCDPHIESFINIDQFLLEVGL